MKFTRRGLGLAVLLALAACGHNKFRRYNGPEVTQIQVYKSQRVMLLLHDDKILKSYKIALGSDPVGPKRVEGDGKTPEGLYYIDGRNPNSAFHLSLRISYPDPDDVKAAKALHQKPGGDIFIHGIGAGDNETVDWTNGCIAVSDRQMEDVYAMVKTGTPIFIMP